ncbi:MAG: polynucleotide adenylyltransferase, partial [Lachnospiraceae bacterium]|nr:polynucleotide adenylyltransferase [Lachnospiraceae bacterium]
GVRRAVCQVGEDLFPEFLQVKRADTLAQHPGVQEDKLCYLDELEKIYQSILERGDCMSLKAMAVTGKDLLAAGLKPGRELGVILEMLLDDVLTHPEHNRKEYLLERALNYAASAAK